MAFIPNPDTWRVVLEYSNTGNNNAANVLHFMDGDGAMTLGRATQLGLLVRAWADAEWDLLASTDWTMGNIVITDASSQTGVQHVDVDTTPGAIATPPLPSQDTIALKLNTGQMGRSNRGRLYHVGLGEGHLTDGLVDPTWIAAALIGYFELQNFTIAENFDWVVASYSTNGAPRVTAVNRTITAISVADNKVDRQIRRKR